MGTVRSTAHEFVVTNGQAQLAIFNDGEMSLHAPTQPATELGTVTDAEQYLRMLATFLGYQLVPGLWNRVSDTRALLHGYQLWERTMDDGEVIYNITKVGYPPPGNMSGGYATAEITLSRKGIPARS